MKLIEAEKVKRVMKDYWKAQVDKALTLTFIDDNEANKRINSYLEHNHELLKAIDELPSAQPDTTTHDSIPAKTGKNDGNGTSGDCISRRKAIDAICTEGTRLERNGTVAMVEIKQWCVGILEALPPIQPDLGKYEYHYDHTDCIWYRPEARNRCPVTCAQYRDGWNDAMNYIFRDGKGYRPYRRGEQYDE